MANEVSNFRKKYLDNLKKICSNVDICHWLELAADFERPDGYYYEAKNRLLIIFEHFVFDCSEPIIKNGKSQGSLLRKNFNDKYREVQKEIQSTTNDYENTKVIIQGYYKQNGNTITSIPGENGDKYRNNYINNFEKNFNEHNAKIEEYKKNLISNLKIQPLEVKTVFLIEDRTMFGSRFLKNKKFPGEPVVLTDTLQFQNKLNNSNVDYVIAACQDSKLTSIGYKNDINKKADLTKKYFYIIPFGFCSVFATKIERL